MDFPAISIISGLIILPSLYFINKYAEIFIYPAFFFAIFILGMIGYSITESTDIQGIFEAFALFGLLLTAVVVMLGSYELGMVKIKKALGV